MRAFVILAIVMVSAATTAVAGGPLAGKPVATKATYRIAHKVNRSSLAFSPEGKLLAINVKYTDILLWDVAARKQLRRIATGRTFLRMRFSPDGKTIATGGIGGDGDVCLWDVASGKRKRVLATDRFAVDSLEFTPDGKSLVACASGASKPSTCIVWNLTSGKIARRLKAKDSAFSMAFSPDGRQLAMVTGNKTVEIWDFVKDRPILKLAADPVPSLGSQAVAFSPDGKTLATATASVDGTIRLWDVERGTMRRSFGPKSGGAFSIAFSPDGQKLLAGHFESAQLWDTASGELLKEWKSTAMAVTYSPDGRCVAWGGSTGTTIQYIDK